MWAARRRHGTCWPCARESRCSTRRARRKRCPARRRGWRATAGRFPSADGAFDIVFSNSVIEHVGDAASQARFAREVMRVGRALLGADAEPPVPGGAASADAGGALAAASLAAPHRAARHACGRG